MDLAESLYGELEKQAQLCTSRADIEVAASLKIKIAKLIHILVDSKRTRGELGVIARCLRLENYLTIFLSQELKEELIELVRTKNQEEKPDR